MNNITQNILFRQSVVKYSLKHGVTEAVIRYRQQRRTIYKWIKKYDGTSELLKNKSRRPRSHLKQHTQEEIAQINGL